MSPIPLGILAASGVEVATSTYDLLESSVLSGTQSSVIFSNLVSTYGSSYQHLQLKVVARSNRAADASSIEIQFNSDTATNYRYHNIRGDGTTIVSYDSGSREYIGTTLIPAANFTANIFGTFTMDILDPFETTKQKMTRNFWFVPSGNFKFVGQTGGIWLNTSAIDSIKIYDANASFISGSRFSLYGLRSS